MAKGQGKGSNFERVICKTLSKWWTNGERDDVFWRTAGSGARAKTRSKTHLNTFGQYGDIQATDPVGQPLIDIFTFELKIGYGKSSVADMFDKPKESVLQDWERWIKQVVGDRKNAGSLSWMLITKRDRREPVVFIPTIMFHFFGNYNCRIRKARPQAVLRTSPEIYNYPICVISLKNFLQYITPEVIIKIREEHFPERII